MNRRLQKTKEKAEFFLFTKDIHAFLIKEGYTCLTNLDYIPNNKELKRDCNGLIGYVLLPNQHLFSDGKGNWVKSEENEIQVQREVRLPKDINDPTRAAMLSQSNMVSQMEELMKVFGADDDLPYRHLAWWEVAPDDVKITDSGVQFPIQSERIKEMYDPKTNETFYLLVDKSISEQQRLLWKKINKIGLAQRVKRLRIIR